MQFNAGEGGGMSNNQKHLEWIYNRLINVHNESANVDYMLRFCRIIDVCSTPAIRAALAAEPVGELSPREVEAQEAFTQLRDEFLNRPSREFEVNEVLSIIDNHTPEWV